MVMALQAGAATYFVNQAGSGAADGSSLGNAASIATLNGHTSSAGDIISLNGTCTSQIIPHDSGSAGNVITYRLESDFDHATASGFTDGAFKITSKNFVRIDGQNAGKIRCTANGDGLANQATVFGINLSGCIGVEIVNTLITNLYVHVFNTDNTTGARNTQAITALNCQLLTVSNCFISHAYYGNIWYSDTTGVRTNWMGFSNTISHCSTAYFISNSGGSDTISNVTVAGGWIQMGVNWYDTPNANHIDGIHTATGSGPVMTHLRAIGTKYSGDPSAHSTSTIYLTDNLNFVWIENNYFSASNNTSAEGFVDFNLNSTAPTLQVNNNTMVGIGTGSGGGIGILVHSTASTVVRFKNNIISNVRYGIYDDTGNVGTWDTDYNCFAPIGTCGIINASFHDTLAEWRTATGAESHSINTDPSLGTDGTIGTSSTAKDAGTTVATVTVDRYGDSRPQGSAYDIGMDEYTAAAPPVTVDTYRALRWRNLRR